MNAHHTQQQTIVSFKYLKVFIAIIVVVLIASLAVRIYQEISASSFKNNSFSVLYFGESTFLLNVDKKDKRFTFIDLGNLNKELKGKNTLEMSLFIGAPINAVIEDENGNMTFDDSDDFLSFAHQIKLLTGSDGVKLKRMNAYDLYKFMNVARGVDRENRIHETITDLNRVGIDKTLSELLRDTAIHESNVTIVVVNGTGINGLANEFSQVLANGGYNIIEVRSDTTRDTPSQVQYNEPMSEAVESLLTITSFEAKSPNTSSTSDVSIFLGNDIEGILSELYN